MVDGGETMTNSTPEIIRLVVVNVLKDFRVWTSVMMAAALVT